MAPVVFCCAAVRNSSDFIYMSLDIFAQIHYDERRIKT